MTITLAPDVKPVPGPSPWFPGANFLAFRRDPLTFFTETQRTYGDFAGFSFGPQRVYLVSHPDWIEDVLVTSAKKFQKGVALQRAKRLLGEGLLTAEGKYHLKQRRTIQPLFHRQQVQRFGDAMVKHGVRWRDALKDGSTIDVTAEMAALTLAIVGETLFSSDVQGHTDEVRDALEGAVQSFGISFLPGLEYFEKLPLPMFTRVRKSRERLDKVIHKVIADRRRDEPKGSSPHGSGGASPRGSGGAPPQGSGGASPQESGGSPQDLVSMLLAARDPENPSEPGMSDQQIRDEALTIFLAGHETTANAMAWTWHLLGSSPSVEEKLHAELDRVLAGRTPTAEDVPQLEYARAVIAESMRIYPPAWTMGRRAIERHTIDGHVIQPGSLVIVSQWVAHRDPRWWLAPERFNPDRWTAKLERPKYAYFPFGGGARLCIGESFAWTETILLLATIAQRWRFEAGAPPRMEPRITLRPKDLRMRAIAR